MLASPQGMEHRHLHHELEQAITTINRDQISAVAGTVSKDAFINAVKMVACLRARYLFTVLQLGGKCHSECVPTASALELKNLREAYTEALDGFAALEHALQRGYLKLRREKGKALRRIASGASEGCFSRVAGNLCYATAPINAHE